jgi:ubiquinol-cytochrome c reductase cytochrome b subunit
MASNWREWVADRFALNQIRDNVLNRRVAKGSWYYGDGATLLFLLGVLVVTGAFMTPTYSPTPDTAYQSIRHITHVQPLGWFLRGLHYWSAGMMVVMLFWHLFRQLLVAGYKYPREGTWLLGVLLFFGVLTMSFTGYLLRWDERAVYAIKVSLHMFQRVPLIGEELVQLVQGGRELGAVTLTRLYSVHVIFVPFLILALAGYHLYLVIVHGITAPTERRQPVHSADEQKRLYKQDAQSEERGETFYPVTMAKSGAMAAVVFGIILVLTLVVGPRELEPEANLVSPAFPAEEWWFWWYSSLVALLPPAVAPLFYVLFPLLLFVILAALPFVDRGPYRGMAKRPVAVAVVVVCVLALFALTALRRISPWTGWPLAEPPPVPRGVQLTAEVEQGRQLFARYGCNSCHAVAGTGPQVGTDLARLSHRYSQAELRNYILHPPVNVPMPSYVGRMTEQELERVVDFVLVAQTFPREP